MQQIGLEAVLKDADFQRGIAQMINAMNSAGATAQRTAQTSTQSFDRISVGAVAMGNIIANVVTSSVAKLASAIEAVPKYFVDSLATTAKWGEGLANLQAILGGTNEETTGLAVGMQIMMGDVEGGTSALSYFSRQTALTRQQFADAADTFRTASADAGEQIKANLADAAEQVAAVWSEAADKRAETEQGLADDVAKIQEDLNTRLSDIAEQRAKNEADLTKSLSRLEEDTKDRLRSARSVKERRQIKKDAAQRKQDLIDQYNEQQAQLAKEEAREQATADKQIALAEKVAQKQIDAAEKAAEKQADAIEKALAKQNAAIEKSMQKSQQAMSDVEIKSPLSKALAALGLDFEKISDTSRPFEERLGDIMDAFAKMPKGVDTTAVALELFGKTGVRWLHFLALGRKGLEDMKKSGIDLGLVLDPEVMERYNQSLERLDLGVMSIAVNIGKTLLPYAQTFIDTLNGMIAQAMPKFQNMLGRLNTAFQANGFQGLFDQMGVEFSKLTSDPNFQKTLNDAMQWVSDTLGAALTAIVSAATWIGDALNALMGQINTWYNSGGGKEWLAYYGDLLATTLINSFTGALGALSDSVNTAIYQALGMSLDEAKWYAKGNLFGTYRGPNTKTPYVEPVPEFARGGWVPRDMFAKIHRGEYVLDPQRAMAFAPVLAGSTTRNIYQFGPNTWNGNPSAADRAAIEQWADGILYRGIRRVVRAG